MFMENLRGEPVYIDGHPCAHGNIVGFINSSSCPLFYANCSFEEHFNDQVLYEKESLEVFCCT